MASLDQAIFRFNVAMVNAHRVQIVHRVQHLLSETTGVGIGQPALGPFDAIKQVSIVALERDDRAKRSDAVEELHHPTAVHKPL